MCNKSATDCSTLKIKAPLYCQTSNTARTPSLDKLLHCHIKILNKYRNQSSLVVSDQSNHQSRHNQESLIISFHHNQSLNHQESSREGEGRKRFSKKGVQSCLLFSSAKEDKKKKFHNPSSFLLFLCVCALGN